MAVYPPGRSPTTRFGRKSLKTEYKMSDKHSEHDKSIHFMGEQLHGTLCVPTATQAQKVVLMLPGSGEIDRNENAMTIQLNTLNTIAHQLAQAGIASFRYDKRGVALSGGNYHETGFNDFVDDARQWLASISGFTEIPGAQCYLLGHAEGALTASLVSKDNPQVKGQILITPFTQNIEAVIEQQLQQTMQEINVLEGFKGFMARLFVRLSGDQVKKQRKIFQQVKNTSKSSIKIKKTLINAKWLRELSAIDPKQVFASVIVPSLVIGGEKDLQCRPQDAHDIAQLSQAPVQVNVLENLTHILRLDNKPASIFRYKELTEKPVDSQISQLIITWMRGH